ncbi:GGDEF domain-containing protein [Aquipuribacter sp. SD81]|uniref:GGDEF domain-containing protein n=1 Tax=Aquipuribacter sp. SD81 TaxID=3127703 RepID=UPI0030189115
MSAPSNAALLPLSQRLRWSAGVRLALALVPPLLWWLVPPLRSGHVGELAVPALVLGALGLCTVPLLRLGRAVALAGLALGLLLDGAYLGWAFLLLGDLEGPVGYVVLVHGVAVTLLLSFRTGLKLVLWHSMVLVLAVQAAASGLVVGTGTPPGPFPLGDVTLLLALLWAGVLGTSTFAAVNERELRRRRHDVEVLLRLARRLESLVDVVEIATLLTRVTHDELLAERTLVVAYPNLRQRGQGATVVPRAGTAVRRVGAAEVETLLVPEAFPDRSVAQDAVVRGAPRLVPSLDARTDGWLAEVLPDAENVLLVPFHLEHQVSGALLMAMGGRRGWLARLAGRAVRIERRRVATARQATAHAAQALGRAALFGRLREAADTDGLTGLANRRTFDRALQQQVSSTLQQPFSLLLVDLDHFKRLNDTHGHQAGDDALRVAAGLLQLACRDGDLAARYGGEEFAVILPGVCSDDALPVAERIRAEVETADGPVPVTASIGVACWPKDAEDPQELLAVADAALYRAKKDGRNRVVSASGSLRPRVPGP